MLKALNPATGETLWSYPEMNTTDVQEILSAVQDEFRRWRKTAFPERTRLMRAAAARLRRNCSELALLMTREMGKPIRQARAEVEKCAWVCDYYAENAAHFLQPEQIATEGPKSFVSFQPLGIVLAVMPWNFPFWQVFRFAAPALMAGNAAVLKHASNVPGCALALEALFREAGFPENLFRTLLIGSGSVAAVLENPLVTAVSLTGSTPAGRAVAARAGALLKKTVLELGGSDPYLVLEDANLDEAVAACVTGRLINSGQSCIAAKRFIVVKAVQAEFERRVVNQMRSRRLGDPLNEDTDIGPLARLDLREELHQQVRESIKQGAVCLLGGRIPGGPGAYYPPTVLTQVPPEAPAYSQELFGPVAAIIPVNDEREAIRVANATGFGLGAAVFTGDPVRGETIAEQELEAGACFVNTYVKSDPRLPFGGIKESGYGRELSHYGIREFVNIKTVFIQ